MTEPAAPGLVAPEPARPGTGGRMTDLPGGEQVWVAATPGARPGQERESTGSAASVRELVLCVHGMAGASGNWSDLIAELAPDFDCAALDLPGSGSSPPPRSRRGYTISGLAGTVIRLAETLRDTTGHPGPLHLVGNSMGGSVAVRVAARRPDLVRTLTLISPALPDPRLRRPTAHFPVIGLPLVGERLVRHYAGASSPEDRVAGVYQAVFADPARLSPEQFALEVEALRRRDALGYEATSLARAARTLVAETLLPPPLSLWSAAARVTAPSLVLFGADDRLVSPRLAGRAARAFRDARAEVLPDTGHIAQMEHPALVAELFRELADRARRAGIPAADDQLKPVK